MIYPQTNSNPKSNKTIIRGCGLIAARAANSSELWRATKSGESLLSPTLDGLPPCGLIDATLYQQDLKVLDFANRLEAIAPDYRYSKAHQISIYALEQSLTNAGWPPLNDRTFYQRCGFIFATTTGLVPLWENDLKLYLNDRCSKADLIGSFKHQPLALIMQQILAAYDFVGRQQLITSACAASTQAIAMAHFWLQSGAIDRCIVGGTELLCQLTETGFNSFQLLSPQIARPFAAERNGINLSEASAFICLEASSTQSTKNQTIFVEGAGIATDAYHMTAPHPQGEGSARALAAALSNANRKPRELDWIYAHGTGSQHNDSAEAIAIASVFGTNIPVSSTKAVHGHSLAVSGLLEVCLGIEALREGIIPATVNCDEIDASISANIVTHNLHDRPVRNFVKNTLGFGGSNAAVIISKRLTDG